MARETAEAMRRRARKVIDRLDAHMPGAKIELDFGTPFQLLVSVILSAQCTDKRVNLVTPDLFRRYPTAADCAHASPAELESLIKTCGLFRSKTRSIIAAAKALVEKHQGDVPKTRAELEALPGVGRKTAGVVCIHLGGDAALPVDTHIRRLARRLGFSRSDNPDQVELDLQALLPRDLWAKSHQLLIWHGRRACFARSPACDRCVVANLCPKIGVSRRKANAGKRAVLKERRPPLGHGPGTRSKARRTPRTSRPSPAPSAS
jgi:endonuclease-3